eukprot:1031483-Pelagomonas_calceolata.AAC.1
MVTPLGLGQPSYCASPRCSITDPAPAPCSACTTLAEAETERPHAGRDPASPATAARTQRATN